ncbi:MAG: hypothetical protein AAGF53_02295 [Pseudomonadota bacterium]
MEFEIYQNIIAILFVALAAVSVFCAYITGVYPITIPANGKRYRYQRKEVFHAMMMVSMLPGLLIFSMVVADYCADFYPVLGRLVHLAEIAGMAGYLAFQTWHAWGLYSEGKGRPGYDL